MTTSKNTSTNQPNTLDTSHTIDTTVSNQTTPISEELKTTEIYRPEKTQVLYTTLLDNSDIKEKSAEISATQPVYNQPVNMKIIYDTVDVNPPTPTQQPINFAKTEPINNPTLSQEKLVKTHKSESLTDKKIMAQSHQLLPTQDRLADETNTLGTMIEHLDVATNQWEFSVNWEHSTVPKAGFFNKLKNKTETLDLDLSCLLCNRYGEVIERVWFKNMRDQAESVRHHGDELVGSRPALPENIQTDSISSDSPTTYQPSVHDKHANQERISIYFPRIPPTVFHLVFILSAYQGAALSNAKNGLCQLNDDEGNIIHEFQLASINDNAAIRVATLTRSSDSWRYHTDMMPLEGYQLNDITQQISDAIVRTAK